MSRVAESLKPDLFAFAPMRAPLARAYPAGVPVEICDKFEQVALQVHALGFPRYSARAIAHRLRWHENIEKGNREFRIDNVWTPAMARWFVAKHPDMKGFFEMRESQADD